MRQAAVALALAAVNAVAGCASVPPATARGLQPIDVADVLKRHHELDGSVIRVRGVIPYCRTMACPIRDLADAGKSFGLGTGAGFDSRARAALNRVVVVQGRFDASCLHSQLDGPETLKNMVICLDRAEALIDPKFVTAR